MSWFLEIPEWAQRRADQAERQRWRALVLVTRAREYQRIAADAWLTAKGLLLADNVGLGKTAVAIAALTDPRTRPALVVTLAHLPRQWEAEFRKVAPGMATHVIKKGTPSDLRKPRRHVDGQGMLPGVDGTPDVLITTYHKFAGWEETLAGVVRSVVFDEVQELRGGLHRPGASHQFTFTTRWSPTASGTSRLSNVSSSCRGSNRS